MNTVDNSILLLLEESKKEILQCKNVLDKLENNIKIMLKLSEIENTKLIIDIGKIKYK